nr:Dihydrofolate reductase [uncultured bacterium]
MNNPKISIIAALSKNYVIGKDNKIPWNIPSDVKRFREITKNHVIIMGRKTYESIGKPLPHRTNIVVTSNPNYQAEGTIVCHSLNEAIDIAKEIEEDEIFIIGGGKIYEEVLPITDKLYLTIVDTQVEGDASFPHYDQFKNITLQEEHEENNYKFTYLNLEK